MELYLSQIEKEVHATWLDAARNLMPHLGPLEWPYEGTVRTEVHTDEVYEVFVDLDGDQILSYSCTCDEEGPICLHTVALLLAIADIKE